MSLVMGTAGHIDHGKTSLVKALTGVDCDRLEEEKRRGITIELGFTAYTLVNGEKLGIVDVPGHEKFLRNMVAGAAGIDFVMLVVAADESLMPQTKEHLEICALLGIHHGFVALTKIDMVDATVRALAEEEIREYLLGTFLENAPVVPVSSVTGEGLADVRDVIENMVKKIRPLRRTDFPRLPVDRVFTMKGHGTVVTGTLLSGEIHCAEEMGLYGKHGIKTLRVRGIQSHGEPCEKAEAGRRISLNLAGVEVTDIERGDVLAPVDGLVPARRWIMQISMLPSAAKPIKHRTELHFHHGGREMLARVHLLGKEKLEAGEQAFAEIRFGEDMAGLFGDPAVLRASTGAGVLRTVAGGRLLVPFGEKQFRHSLPEAEASALATLAASMDTAIPPNSQKQLEEQLEARLFTQLNLAGENGVSQNRLLVLCNVENRVLEKTLARLGNVVFCFDKEERVWISRLSLEKLMEKAQQNALTFHKKEPLKAGCAKGVLLSGLHVAPKLAHAVLEKLLKQGVLVAEGENIRHKDHSIKLEQGQTDVKSKLLLAFSQKPPLALKQALEESGINPKDAAPLLKILTQEKELVKISEDIYFTAAEITAIQARLLAFFQNKETMEPADFKEIAGNYSRKYLIPLMEYFDKERVTLRVGDTRVLRK